jgi:plastocyanin
MSRGAGLALGVLAAAMAVGACSGAGPRNMTGTGGAGGGGGSGGPSFMAVPPCSAQASYTTAPTTITFGGADGDNYNPKCLAVTAGTDVIFAGDFLSHPLTPSAMRGTVTGNPIVSLASGDRLAIHFSDPGFYAYYCRNHGSDDGLLMAGVVWVE